MRGETQCCTSQLISDSPAPRVGVRTMRNRPREGQQPNPGSIQRPVMVSPRARPVSHRPQSATPGVRSSVTESCRS
jgi:hypothetical protein